MENNAILNKRITNQNDFNEFYKNSSFGKLSFFEMIFAVNGILGNPQPYMRGVCEVFGSKKKDGTYVFAIETRYLDEKYNYTATIEEKNGEVFCENADIKNTLTEKIFKKNIDRLQSKIEDHTKNAMHHTSGAEIETESGFHFLTFGTKLSTLPLKDLKQIVEVTANAGEKTNGRYLAKISKILYSYPNKTTTIDFRLALPNGEPCGSIKVYEKDSVITSSNKNVEAEIQNLKTKLEARREREEFLK